MPAKKLKIKDILAKNRAIDHQKFADALRLIEELRAQGLAGPAYDLSSPYDRRMKAIDLPPNFTKAVRVNR